MRDAARRLFRSAAPALLGSALALLLPAPAQAQWKWVTPAGVTQYSDQPPPPGTPARDILARPTPNSVPQPGEPSSSPAASAVQQQMRKHQQQLQAERKAQEQARQLQAQVQAQQRQQLCEQAQQQLQVLDSGRRVRQLDANGVPVYLDSGQVQAQRAQAQAQVDAACR